MPKKWVSLAHMRAKADFQLHHNLRILLFNDSIYHGQAVPSPLHIGSVHALFMRMYHSVSHCITGEKKTLDFVVISCCVFHRAQFLWVCTSFFLAYDHARYM